MEKLPYLKEHLQTNLPQVVTISKRIGQYPETDYNTKQPTGRMQTLYNFSLPNGTMTRHYAKEREEETLGLFNAGESVQVVLQESKNDETGKRFTFLVWTPTEGAEARLASNPPVQSNTRQTATEKELKEKREKDEERWAKNEIGQTLGMLTKLAMTYCNGDFDLALKQAKEWRPKYKQAVNDCYAEDTFKISPTPSPEIDPSDLPF